MDLERQVLSGEIDVEHFADWLRQHVPGAAPIQNWKPLWKRITQIMVAGIKQCFDQAKDPTGRPWKPLRYPRPRNQDQGHPLRDRGTLMGSATGRTAVHREEGRPDGFTVEHGTNDQRAWTHQDGAMRKPTRAKVLAIPLTREAVTAGPPRRFPRPLKLVWPKGRRTGWLVEEKQAGQAVKGIQGLKKRSAATVMHYLLVHQVVIPARAFVGWSREGMDDVADATVEFILSRGK